MAVRKMDGTILITGNHIALYTLKSIEATLSLEINTGMKMTKSGRITPMNHAKAICGSTKQTKKGVLADFVEYMERETINYVPMPSTMKALGVERFRIAIRVKTISTGMISDPIYFVLADDEKKARRMGLAQARKQFVPNDGKDFMITSATVLAVK